MRGRESDSLALVCGVVEVCEASHLNGLLSGLQVAKTDKGETFGPASGVLGQVDILNRPELFEGEVDLHVGERERAGARPSVRLVEHVVERSGQFSKAMEAFSLRTSSFIASHGRFRTRTLKVPETSGALWCTRSPFA